MKSLMRRSLIAMAGLLFVFSSFMGANVAKAAWGTTQPYTDGVQITCQSASMLDQSNWGGRVIRTKYQGQNIGVRRNPYGAYGTYINTNGFWTMMDYQYGGWGFLWAACTTNPHP